MSKPVFDKSETNPSSAVDKKRNILISFVSYDQDDFEYKKNDLSFMNSFSKIPEDRHEIWRPSVALAQLFGLDKDYPDLIFSDYYLLCDNKEDHQRIIKEVTEDIQALPSPPNLHVENPGIDQAFDLKDVYPKLFQYLARPEFHDPNVTYYVNCTNGTSQIRNCLFLFAQTGHIKAFRIAPTPWNNHKQRDKRGGLRTVKGSYVTDNPQDFGDAYASIGSKAEKGTLGILQKGVTTKDETQLKRIATIIDKIKAIRNDDFRAKQTILITGETGVGKTHLAENIAEALELIDPKKEKRFVPLNCATIRGADPNIQRIELFGATGKIGSNVEKQDGALLKANGGMLFLDEIGELSLEMQAMLLTALDKGTFTPLGGDPSKPLKSTFQLVCGTNRPLEAFVEEGKFRRDLFNRINAWHFKLRPLRDHREDISDNIKKLTSIISRECGRNSITFETEAETLFLGFANDKRITWDGNFRELNAMITRMVILSDGTTITSEIVKPEIAAAYERYEESTKRRQTRTAPLPVQEPAAVPSAEECDRKKPEEPTSKCSSIAHTGILNFDQAAYDRLTKIEKAEFDLIDEAVNRDHTTDKDKLCHAVYGDKLGPNSLYRRLLAIGLKFSYGRLSHVPPTPQKVSGAESIPSPKRDQPT